jgi:predicted CDP-diglyceride synthetase/phosphatidate cytidylyltransferase
VVRDVQHIYPRLRVFDFAHTLVLSSRRKKLFGKMRESSVGSDDKYLLHILRSGASDSEYKGFEGKNLLLVAFLIIVVQISDVLQYVFGKLFGRRKIAPVLSPSKTVEGFVLGIISASLIGGLLWWITPFTFLQAFLISLILTLLGFLGGLVMSAVKRDRGIKDWGYMIEGHGGILDRFDSVCFAAPIFFHIVRYWWA